MILALAAIFALQTTPLQSFIDKVDGRYGVSAGRPETDERGTLHSIRLVSQAWQGTTWAHDIELIVPKTDDFPDKTLLFITGDRGSSDQDRTEAWKIAELGRFSVAILYEAPNQPIFDLREDDLIAYTFGQYLRTEDDSWPLLFPMVKSAVKAMDAIETYSESKLSKKIERFVVTGASKRAWTSYLVAASDKRVIGLAPMVFDFLDFPLQLEHQRKLWGGYSPMIGSYTERGLHEVVESPQGQRLLDRVDPIRYRDRLTMPKLIILGANDPYWAINAITVYWDRLMGAKAVMYAPNAGHSLNGNTRVHGSLAVFTRLAMAGRPLPSLTWNWMTAIGSDTTTPSHGILTLRAPGAVKTRLWSADSASRNFTESTWNMTAEGGTEFTPKPASGRSGYRAAFGEAEFEIDGIRCWVSTVPIILAGR